MIGLVLRQIEKRLFWRRHARVLRGIETREEFRRYVERVQPKGFLFYQAASAAKRAEVETVLDALGIDLTGKATLDIGPGHGESLDVFHERNASEVHFIDYDPFFYTHNRVKGFTRGYLANHLTQMGLLDSNRYHFIWSRGSIRDDLFRQFPLLFRLDRWLRQIERITAPGGTVVICPYWASREGRRCQPDVARSSFTRTMLRCGYTCLPPIEGHNAEPNFPVSFVRVKPA
jgi:hypothetical protein